MINDQGVIEALEVDTSCEHPDYGAKVGKDEAFLAQFIGKTGPFTLGDDIDAVTKATGTAEAAIAAINDALK